MPPSAPFRFGDQATFAVNSASFATELARTDQVLGKWMAEALPKIADGTSDRAEILSEGLKAIQESENQADDTATDNAAQESGSATANSQIQPSFQPTPVAATAQTRWYLEQIEIEGMRGINNEGAPLLITFKSNCVNSVSAPNGVGKSSIYDCISFALTGSIPKLDRLLTAERGQEYYLNRFHPGNTGRIVLTLKPDDGSPSVPITITSSVIGQRTVTAPAGIDGAALLADLNREFVLLDANTFQTFIDSKALDRGRSFSGLLGLSSYSSMRQELQALCNTKSFNNHFEINAGKARKSDADRAISTASGAIKSDFEALVKSPLEVGADTADHQATCHAALNAIAVLEPHCTGKTFLEIDIDACLASVASAEGGEKKLRHAHIIRQQEGLDAASVAIPSEENGSKLLDAIKRRDDALSETAGELFNELFRLSEKAMTEANWPSDAQCPVCDRDDGSSVLEIVRTKLEQYDAVGAGTAEAITLWQDNGWNALSPLGALVLNEAESARLKQLTAAGNEGVLKTDEAEELSAMLKAMRSRAATIMEDLGSERSELEKQLPPSLVAVTTAVEAARRLQGSWVELQRAQGISKAEADLTRHLKRLKDFLDTASTTYASAESAMAAERLEKILPVCQAMFARIMISPVVPALDKPAGSEEITIRLSEFWGLSDVSAQSVLSESYRNAFAISVYLAAASLYGGAPRFMVLDDITSSFDAGHQLFLAEVIRKSFALPVTPTGPQVIILSHDTYLEKLFNKYSTDGDWFHQRLEGTAQTAVLLQAGAVNKVRDSTITLLNQGRADDAAPRIRQYLEYRLGQLIDKCKIPVPIDLAFNEEKRLAGTMIDAIEAAVTLQDKAGGLILTQAQVNDLSLHSATIVGNYLAHWGSGQAQGYSAPALLGVMNAIDAYVDCFKHEPTPGASKIFYKSLTKK